MPKGVRRVGTALVDSAREMIRHETPRDAAAISYFSLFALFPSTLLLVALADSLFGWMNLHKRVLQGIISLFPGSGQFLAANMGEITTPSPAIVLSCCIVVIWCSTWIFTFIENAMNRIWGFAKDRTFWESRLRSTALLLLGGGCLLTSAGITAIVSTTRSQAHAHMHSLSRYPVFTWMWSAALLGMGFCIATLVFFLFYKVMPDGKVLWWEALSGGLVAAAEWDAGSYIFAKVVPYFDYQRVYGKAGAIIALMAWVYTSTFILLYGAAFSAKLGRPHQAEKHDSQPFGTHEGMQNRVRSFPSSRTPS
jgi:membrane protein